MKKNNLTLLLLICFSVYAEERAIKQPTSEKEIISYKFVDNEKAALDGPPEGAWNIIYSTDLEHKAGVITSVNTGFKIGEGKDEKEIYSIVFSEGRDDPNNLNTLVQVFTCLAEVDRNKSLKCRGGGSDDPAFQLAVIYADSNPDTNLCYEWFKLRTGGPGGNPVPNQKYNGVLSAEQVKNHMHKVSKAYKKQNYVCYSLPNANGPGGGSGTGGNTSGG